MAFPRRSLRKLGLVLGVVSAGWLAASPALAAPPAIAVHQATATGSLPKGVTISPDGARLYVTNYGVLNHHNVSIYDAATMRELGHIDIPGIIVESAIAPDGKTLYVSNFKRNSVQFVDLESRRVTKEAKAGMHPKILVLSHDGRRLFAANWGSSNVTEIDTTTGETVRTLEAQKNPRGMAITRTGRLYVANFNSASIDVFEGRDMQTHRRMRDVCSIPRHLVLSPDESKLYITCMLDNAVAVLDTHMEDIVRRIPVGHFPKATDVTRDGRYVVTADYRGSTTTVIDTRDWKTKTLDVPGMDAASGIVAARQGFKFYVTGWYDNHLYAIGAAGVGPEYTVDPELMRKTEQARAYHRAHPVE